MFLHCEKLETVKNLPDSIVEADSMFKYCLSLKGRVYIPQNIEYFNNIFEKTLLALEEMDKDIPIAVKCMVQEQNDSKSLKAEKILSLEEAQKEKVEFVVQKADTSDPLILLINSQINKQILQNLREAAIKHQGKRELRILFKTQTQELEMASAFFVHSQIKEEFKELEWID